MAKVSLNKLNLKKYDSNKDKVITINEKEIQVKQYLPIEDKLALVRTIAADTVDDTKYVNPTRFKIFFEMRVLLAYTNLSLTPTQEANVTDAYDLLSANGVFAEVFQNIPVEEYTFIEESAQELLQNIYKYESSVLGIMEKIGRDYSEVGEATDTIASQLSNPENLTLLKDILSKLG